jgi:hypothetical protein
MCTFETVRSPYLHLLLGGAAEFEREPQRLTDELKKYFIGQLNGRRMHTKRHLFAEFAAALHFPSYFGNNWDALDECLKDLEWLPAAGYILFISDAIEILSDDTKEMDILLGVLQTAGKAWAATVPPRPFHVVLGCRPELEGLMERRLGNASYDACPVA